MNSSEIRQSFLNFFAAKAHTIVPSAPMVIKNDPTLMFTNAGMNQFKDIFLGNSPAFTHRAADTQKCLRVSGKHNDLEEVGKDTYHHTMFEMLGNWSFGDYFKREAIDWAWEFLTQVVKLDANRMYATVFEGDSADHTECDMEAFEMWKQHLPENRILFGNKKDNFWEMGETGPCGPCSEIHIDLRDEKERVKIDGATLVNKDNPLVIEIWNLVFMQFNRLTSGELQPLSEKHVDTGMGFERLCMAVQGKKSNYDTDIFQPLIQKLAALAKKTYGEEQKTDIALRVIVDHLRAVCFAIADGQLPSNTGAGYVIRRILRRAIRYGFTFLNFKEPFIYTFVSDLASQMGGQFKELKMQQQLIEKVIQEEEHSFLKTLSLGIVKFENYCKKNADKKVISGDFAFELFDTFGFPIDLTQLMAEEIGLSVDMQGFQKGLAAQKERSRAAATIETDDWIILNAGESKFVGYDELNTSTKILRYRKVKQKNREFYQIVIEKTPFYAEMGGQIGDCGWLTGKEDNQKIEVVDTKKENNLSVHITYALPINLKQSFDAAINVQKRLATARNHTATHLLHEALRDILGTHVEQKGSYVSHDSLRFDFSHFQKLSKEEIYKIEHLANQKIRSNYILEESRNTPIAEARKMGAIALFGEKYGDIVRVIKFGNSVELCGGTHVYATGEIGMVKIISESSIAAGIRRIEAITGEAVEDLLDTLQHKITDIQELIGNASDLRGAIKKIADENSDLRKQIEEFTQNRIGEIAEKLLEKAQQQELSDSSLNNEITVIKYITQISAEQAKMLAFQLRKQKPEKLRVVIGTVYEGKPSLTILLSDDLVAAGENAATLIRIAAKYIQGGGGGQPFFAQAGGKNADTIEQAVAAVFTDKT